MFDGSRNTESQHRVDLFTRIDTLLKTLKTTKRNISLCLRLDTLLTDTRIYKMASILDELKK